MREGGREEGKEGGREDVHVTSNVELRNYVPLFGVTQSNVELRNYVPLFCVTQSNVDLRNYLISRQIVIYILWYHWIDIEHTY